MMRVVQVEPREKFKIRVRFDEGTSGMIDLLQDLAGRGPRDYHHWNLRWNHWRFATAGTRIGRGVGGITRR